MTPLQAQVKALRLALEGKRGQSACCVVENSAGEVLLLRRGNTAPWMPGKWNLPGGGVDTGETPKQAAIREAEEEVGIRVTSLKLLTKSDIPGLPDEDLYVFHVTKWLGDPKINLAENDALVWAPKQEAWSYDLVPPLPGILKKLAR